MNLYLRLLMVMLRNLLRQRIHYSTATDSTFRVLPTDLDAFGHMNNGRYLQVMDVARMDWMQRAGIAGAIRARRWSPILGGGVIRFRHSLRLLQRYRVRTVLLGWDERWFYLEHTFIDAAERCVAVGITRAALRRDGDWVPAQRVADSVYPGATSPAMPDYLEEWLGLEAEMYRFGRERGGGRKMTGPALRRVG